MTDPHRSKLTAWRTLTGRSVAYQTPDGIEVESRQNFEVVRRRVFFDDVLMVTIHHEMTPLYLAGMALIGLFFLLIGIVLVNTDLKVAGYVFFAIGAVPVIAFLLRLSFGIEAVTVIGRRSKAAMRFRGRSRRAREVYGALCNTVRDTHRRLEREYAEESTTAAVPPAADAPAWPQPDPAETQTDPPHS
jgi:hypothetical protein